MNPEKRKSIIISKIESGGSVDIIELAEMLNVSEMTIRRDLDILEKMGVVRRVHGGAVSARGRSYEPPLLMRNTQNIQAKEMIARFAADLIEEGDCIALDVGSTTMEIARFLVDRQNLTVITPSLNIANLLVNQVGIRVIVTGGVLRFGEASMIGELAQNAFSNLYVDKLILAVGGIDAQAGLTEYNWDDTLVKKAMLNCAKQVIAVSDASKYGQIAFARIAGFSAIHILVTDQNPPDEIQEKLIEAGVDIMIAS